jgi:hypothetical protein
MHFFCSYKEYVHEYTPKLYINTMHTKQSVQSMSYKLVQYYYTYAPCPIPGNIGIPICQSIHPSQCYACFCFVSRFCPMGINLVSEASTMFLRHQPSWVHPLGIHPKDRSLALCHQPFMTHPHRSMASTLYEASTSFYGINLFLRRLPFVSAHEASTLGLVLYLCGINPCLWGIDPLLPPLRHEP